MERGISRAGRSGREGSGVASLVAVAGLVLLAAEPLRADPVHRGAERNRDARSSPARKTRPPADTSEPGSIWDVLRRSDRLTGGWGGLRDRLSERGVDVESTVIVDASVPSRGALRQREAVRSLVDLNVSLDLGKLAGWSGATVFADGYGYWGRSGSGDVGDFQVYSNIDNDLDRVQLAELWIQQELFGERVRLKLGKLDANSEFAFVDVAGEFVNSSAGFSPTIFPLPTYPEPSTGALVFLYPTSGLYAGMALFDGTGSTGFTTGNSGPRRFFDDDLESHAFLIGEVGLRWSEGVAPGPGRLAAGPWHHTGRFDRFDGGRDHGTTGFFVLAEQRLLRFARPKPDRSDDDPGRGLDVFAQYGWADADVSAAAQHASLGVVAVGPFDARSDDALGAMVSWVDLSDRAGAGFDSDETAFELFYRFALTGAVQLKPDLHVIHRPGGVSGKGVVVGTLRIEVTL
ncbi:MAG: carbohydrate porin [Myxococcota bacterium]|nr:carbohydrate porin [Myxococcales bacterium]